MERENILNERQEESIKAWMDNDCIGTLNMAVGTGKTITAFKCALEALKKGILQKGDIIRFMAETDARWITIGKEIEDFHRLTGIWISDYFRFTYECYQGVPPWNGSVMDVYDEIHMALTDKYHVNILNSNARCKLGLSATIPENQTVFVSQWPDEMRGKLMQSHEQTDQKEITSSINKGQLLKILCPIVYRYDIEQAIADGVLATFETYVIYHYLDSFNLTIPQKYGNVSEAKMYEIWAKAMRKSYKKTPDDVGVPLSDAGRAFIGRKMANFLYGAKSKQELVKAILKLQNRPTILFSVIKEPMRAVTPNVAEGSVIKLVNQFNTGAIQTIGTSKKLKQGITLQGVENAILMSYTSKSWELIQQLGRIVRWAPGKKAKLFIIVTRDTLEEKKWFPEMTRVYSESLNLLGHVGLNIVGYLDGRSIIQQAKSLK